MGLSRSAICSPRCEDVFPKLETFPTAAERFPEAGNLPDGCGTFSRSWKPSRRLQDVFPKLETFPTAAGRFPEAGNLPDGCGTFSRCWKPPCRRRDVFPMRMPAMETNLKKLCSCLRRIRYLCNTENETIIKTNKDARQEVYLSRSMVFDDLSLRLE